jgi:hypothetical protein
VLDPLPIPMFKSFITILALTAALAGFALSSRSSLPVANPGAKAAASRSPVLVELFTSEGCSSCPPADELLARLEQSQPVAGAEVIALSEHVDYWNRLGWNDPYSSAEFSSRQNDYARIFNTDDVYTPQMVVDGRAQFVGSNSGKAREAIEDSARDPKANVSVAVAAEDKNAASLTLAVRVEGLPQVSKDGSAEVLLAITESGLRSNVSRGENAGRRLTHSAVVRQFTRIGSIDSPRDGVFGAQPVVRIEKAWNRENLKAVVFVQEPATRRVMGVAGLSLAR